MDSVQKKILNQSMVSQSLYIQNIASLNSTINNNNEGKKLDSYQRYLMKKKGLLFSQQGKKQSTPLIGNKSKSFSFTNYMTNKCDKCS